MLFGWFSKRKEKKDHINEIVSDMSLNKSEKMRKLFNEGMDVTAIADLLGVRYNFVYNVVRDHLRVNSMSQANANIEIHETKKQQIIQLFQEEHSMTEISKLLATDYNYVTRVVKEYKRRFQTGGDNNSLKF